MITLGTFNMRVDTKIDGARRFDNRKPLMIAQFLDQLPTLMGLQEITPPMAAYLKENLPQYALIGSSRNKDFSGEKSPIVYLKSTLSLHRYDTFWLSPTPTIPGSRYFWQSPYPRICTWAVFYHKASQKRFRFYNTHLDHISPYARKKAIKQIIQTIIAHQAEETLPLFVVGDFNFTPRKKEYALFGSPYLPLQNLVKGFDYTYHGFQKRGLSSIDYIFTNIEKKAFPLSLWEKSPQGDFLSDHRGLIVAWEP